MLTRNYHVMDADAEDNIAAPHNLVDIVDLDNLNLVLRNMKGVPNMMGKFRMLCRYFVGEISKDGLS